MPFVSKLFPKWHCKRLLRTDPLKALVTCVLSPHESDWSVTILVCSSDERRRCTQVSIALAPRPGAPA